MAGSRRGGIVCLAIAASLAGCAPSAQPSSAPTGVQAVDRAQAPKRIVVAISGTPTILSFKLIGGGNRGGVDAIEDLIQAAMTTVDGRGDFAPRLAEHVPTIENGLWRLLPDGRMETIWTIRADAQWHDGAPFSSEDLVFTSAVVRDSELPQFGDAAYASIEAVTATDSRTVSVTWKRLYIGADALFGRDLAPPLPQHLLGGAYRADKAGFLQAPYWTRDYVGAGPYRVQDYVADSHMILAANDRYVLGRPKIDEIEVRFIPDSNTLQANVLAGTISLTLGYGISLDDALQARDRWTDGRLEVAFKTWILAHPQMLNPDPAVISDVRFRRALVHAINRQEMTDTIQAGLVPIADSAINPAGSDYATVRDAVVRYDYDPRQALQLMESAGYRRGSDGGLRDAAGQRLSVEIRTPSGLDITQKSLLSIADYWQRVGVDVQPLIIPLQRARDREYRAAFPGFELTRTSSDARFPPKLHSREAPVAQNSFAGSNNSRYINPGYDALVDRYIVAVPKLERAEALRGLIHHLTDQVVPLGLMFDVEPILIGNELKNVAAVTGERATSAWNAHEWDI